MALTIIMLILIILFALWIVFSFFHMAVLALVNFVIGGIIVLRSIHDFREKRNIALYLFSVGISGTLIILGISRISPFLSRFMILEITQLGILIFAISQILIVADKRLFSK